MFDAPDAVPTSMTYDLGAAPEAGGRQLRVTRVPVTDAAMLVGVPGDVEVAVTEALAVAVWPAAFLATSVKVVSPVTVTFDVPDRETPAPLMVAVVAFAVCHVTV